MTLRCSFCKKSEDQVAKLVAGPDVYICDECVAVASRLMLERRGFFRRLWDRLRAVRILKFDRLSALDDVAQ
jgi:ATP-dependent protease Clp ATPase subunit